MYAIQILTLIFVEPEFLLSVKDEDESVRGANGHEGGGRGGSHYCWQACLYSLAG